MYDREDTYECEEIDTDDEFADTAEAAGNALAETAAEQLTLIRAQEKLDNSLESSGMTRLEMKSVKQLEHAILSGDPAEIARGLKAVAEIRQNGNPATARAIEARVTEDFRKAGLYVTFDEQGNVEITSGAPRFFSVDKDGNYTSRFWSGQLAPATEEENNAQSRNPLERAGADAARGAQAVVQEIEDKRTTQRGLQYLGRTTADRISRGTVKH